MTRAEIIAELRDLSGRMLDVAVVIEYYGGFNGKAAQHAAELVGASSALLTWADGMEAEA